MLSKTTTNVRPGRRGAVFVEMRGGSGRTVPVAVASGSSGGVTTSKFTSAWGVPSSRTVKSSRRRPVIGFPALSVTTTSTVTTSTSRLNVGGGSWLAAEAESERSGSRGKSAAREDVCGVAS